NDDVVLIPIHDIQGNGNSSPLVTQTVTTSGIVTGLKTNGFFIGAAPADWDADPNTPGGSFWFTGSAPPPAAVLGNKIQFSGTVQEFVPTADPFQKPLTELGSINSPVIMSTGNPLPNPIEITAASTQLNLLDNLEPLEGMRVTVPSLTVIAPTQGTITESSATVSTSGVFYGVVTGVARPFRETGINISDPLPAGAPATVPRFDENPERIRI